MASFDKVKKKLEAQLHKLTARAEDIDEDLSKTGDDDWQEQAIESEGDEVLEEIGEVTLDEIRQIKVALSRIDAGTYGQCAQCGGTIAAERLSAIPYATKCVKCS